MEIPCDLPYYFRVYSIKFFVLFKAPNTELHAVRYGGAEAVFKCHDFVTNSTLVPNNTSTNLFHLPNQILQLLVVVQVHIPDDAELRHEAVSINLDQDSLPAFSVDLEM